MLQAVIDLKGTDCCPPLVSSSSHSLGAEYMFSRKNTPNTDRRDEIVLAVIALLIPLATLPAMLGL